MAKHGFIFPRYRRRLTYEGRYDGEQVISSEDAGKPSRVEASPYIPTIGTGIKSAAQKYRHAVKLSSFFYLLSVIFLILVSLPGCRKESATKLISRWKSGIQAIRRSSDPAISSKSTSPIYFLPPLPAMRFS